MSARGTDRASLETGAPALARLITTLKGLAHEICRHSTLQLRVPEQNLIACYPPGTAYKRHLDSYGGADNPRIITAIVYLNPDWVPAHGGWLRVSGLPENEGGGDGDSGGDANGGEAIDIAPLPGRLVVFLSQKVWHEVRPSAAMRYAVSLWIWDTKRDKHGR